jgi:hypothetical protein
MKNILETRVRALEPKIKSVDVERISRKPMCLSRVEQGIDK